MTQTPPLRFVLASASPARLATLRAAGVEPEVVVSAVDEEAISADTVAELVQLLATAKASDVAATLSRPAAITQPAMPNQPAAISQLSGPSRPALVLGCDSLLELDGVPLGKPRTAARATARWQAMRGRTAVLHTGHTLIAPGGRSVAAVASTAVRFADIAADDIAAYVATGEPLEVAGAFTVDGIGGWFVEAVDGDHHNVVGLSLPLLRRMLTELGYGLGDIGLRGFAVRSG